MKHLQLQIRRDHEPVLQQFDFYNIVVDWTVIHRPILKSNLELGTFRINKACSFTTHHDAHINAFRSCTQTWIRFCGILGRQGCQNISYRRTTRNVRRTYNVPIESLQPKVLKKANSRLTMQTTIFGWLWKQFS